MITIRYTYRRFIFLAILAALIFIPLPLWVASQSMPSVLSASGILRSIGHLCGLMGATLFSINFILSARLRWIEEALDGLPRVFNLHHLAGGIAFILLIAHPVFLGLQYVPSSISSAANFFVPNFTDIPKMFGVASLSILTILLVITFFIRIAYHHWKITHQWLGLALILASLHVYTIPGHLDSAPWLRWYMMVIIVAGLAAFGYRVLFGRWLVKRYNYVVDRVKIYPHVATEARLLPVSSPIHFSAGQFFFLRVHTDKGITREPHPFSFTSKPSQTSLSFTAKTNGDYTSKLLPNLQKGMKVDIEGPYGRFLFSRGGRKQVWIAGGVGITPFMSRVRELHNSTDQIIHLYYVVKNRNQAIFLEELMAIAKKVKGFSIELYESESRGRFNYAELISPQFENSEYFICGPSNMMADINQHLLKSGVKKINIHTESFKLY